MNTYIAPFLCYVCRSLSKPISTELNSSQGIMGDRLKDRTDSAYDTEVWAKSHVGKKDRWQISGDIFRPNGISME